MHDNIEFQEGGAALRAGQKLWRVPFRAEGHLTIRAETPEEADEFAMNLDERELAAAADVVHIQEPVEVVE
jgi:hypothetical protein